MKAHQLLLAAWMLIALACDAGEETRPSDSKPQSEGTEQAGSAAPVAPMQSGSSDSSAQQAAKPSSQPQMPAAQMPAPSTPSQPAGQPQTPAPAQAGGKQPFKPFGPDAELVSWSTDKFTLEPGQERYLCFAKALDQEIVANGYSASSQPFVHHLILARATAPEPVGLSECDVAFRSSWETLFITGAGNSALELPSDAGHALTKGTQLVVQMHLLNVTEKPVEGSVTIDMRRSSVAQPRPVSSFIFGTAAVKLPAGKTSTVVGNCAARRAVKLIAGFPHMHLLGTSMTLEVGTQGAMKQVFKRDPFSFNDQRIDKVELDIAAGQQTRVTCTYDNTSQQEVGYGESTHNEMCYFVGFAVDLPKQSACLEVIPPLN